MLKIFGWPKSSGTDLERLESLREEIHSAEHGQPTEASYHQAKIALALGAIAKEHKAQGRDASRQQSKVLFWTRMAFFGLVAYTGVTVWLAVIGHQANVLNATTGRAWLTVEVKSATSSLRWLQGFGPTLDFSITAKNVGNSPATDVRINNFLFFTRDDAETNVKSLLRKPCAFPSLSGNIVFQGESWSGQNENFMDFETTTHIEAAFDKVYGAAIHLTPKIIFPLSGIACVSYKIKGDGDTHYTIRSFTIGKTDDQGRRMWATYLEDIPAGRMALDARPNGDYTD